MPPRIAAFGRRSGKRSGSLLSDLSFKTSFRFACAGRKPGGRAEALPHFLIQEVRPVKRVALFGDEARVADHAAEFLFGGLMVGARSRDYVLFDHDAADVVASKA